MGLKSIAPSILVLAGFWSLTLWSFYADSSSFRARKSREWILDVSGLIFQGILVPVIQILILWKALEKLAPSLQGHWSLAAPLAFALNFVLVDYVYYWNHRLLHTRWFWRAHAVHHSIEKLDPVATSRNTLWSPLLMAYLWLNAVALFVLKDSFWFVVGAAATSVLDLWRHSFVHAHAPTSRIGRAVSWLMISPNDHAWHHSATHTTFNFGGNFNLWDRLHGTFSRRNDRPLTLGIATGWTFTEEILGWVPRTRVSVLGRAMPLFPVAIIALTLLSAVYGLIHQSIALGAVALFCLYGLPPLAFRLHNFFFPLKGGLSRLSGGEYSSWWGGHQIQVLYLAVPSLEGILRLIPGLYSLWLRAWGSEIGKNVYWTPQVDVTDRSLLKIGDNVVIGHRVGFYAHAVTATGEKFSIYVKPITIGTNVFLGACSRFAPGSHVDDGAVLPILTDARVNERITREMIFNPSEKINSLFKWQEQ